MGSFFPIVSNWDNYEIVNSTERQYHYVYILRDDCDGYGNNTHNIDCRHGRNSRWPRQEIVMTQLQWSAAEKHA